MELILNNNFSFPKMIMLPSYLYNVSSFFSSDDSSSIIILGWLTLFNVTSTGFTLFSICKPFDETVKSDILFLRNLAESSIKCFASNTNEDVRIIHITNVKAKIYCMLLCAPSTARK